MENTKRDYATKYLEGHSEIDAEWHPAYAYLEAQYYAHDAARIKATTKAPQTVEVKSSEQHQTELNTLFNGLTLYFQHADTLQEQLLRRVGSSARKMLIREALFAGMAADSEITDSQKLVVRAAEILKAMTPQYPRLDTSALTEEPSIEEIKKFWREDVSLSQTDIEAISEETLREHYLVLHTPSRNADFIAALRSEEMLEAVKATASDETPEARKALAMQIDAAIEKVEIPELNSFEEAITSFRKSRQILTRNLNAYDDRLNRFQRRLEWMISKIESESNEQSKNGIREDLATLWEMLVATEDRMSELELFRNSLQNTLHEQPEILRTPYQPKSERVKTFLNQEGLDTLVLEDIGRVFHQKTQEHPLVNIINSMNGRLRSIVQSSACKDCQSNIPGMELRENGKKSWRRTVDKLIWEKGGQWELMTDMARVGAIFDSAESKYLFNRMLRQDIAQSPASPDPHAFDIPWQIHGPDKTQVPAAQQHYSDRGNHVRSSGVPIWLMHPNVGEYAGQQWGVEIKLEDEQQVAIEHLTHKLFECQRLVEGKREGTGIKGVDHSSLTEERYQRFTHRIVKDVELLKGVTGDSLQKEARNLLTGLISKAKQAHQNIHDHADTLYQMLEEAHFVLSCDAARNSSPLTAAEYHHKATEMLLKRKGADGLEKWDEEAVKENIQNRPDTDFGKYAELYLEHGPRTHLLGSHTLDRADTLIQQHRDSFDYGMGQRIGAVK